ncbi:polysaccharide pyruvyl transferase family protein [Fundicoccus sp. Sow4_D5]|uniref:polysaccharide pyruvyl transferase family protein n=1 Tax=Fundicoccus sp. Sow4_D5 TaxID=3438782 RepID=UPI003F8F7ABE
MKKASIISFQFADNYGALLQIYALSYKLKNKGLSVEVVDFSPKELNRPYALGLDIKYTLKKLGFFRTIATGLIKLKNLRKNINKKKNFQRFRNDLLELTEEKYFTSEDLMNTSKLNKYDYYFVGSDQVWNPAFFQYGIDAYFLNFAPKESTKISYAASIAEELDENNKEVFEENLKRFDYISVREESAKKSIESLTDKNVSVTLDPTLLLDKTEWQMIMSNKRINERFILVYDLVRDQRIIELSNYVAEKLNAKIVCFSDVKYYENTLFSFNGENPIDFLKLVNDAEFVITSSFHGTAFSLLFEKQFLTVPHPTRGSRMIDLLETIELSERLVTEFDNDKINLNEIVDYSKVNILIKQLQKESNEFIEKSLLK